MSANKNYPAFPNKLQRGMTLRDYFAANALVSGLCPYSAYDYQVCAEWSYLIADAMLAEREKGGAE
jgi:hypothetical protein